MRSRVASLAVVLAALAACKPPAPSVNTSDPSTPSASSSAATTPATPDAEARQIFSGRCAVCHGATGAGDGPGAAALTPRPRAFRDPAWQTSVTDEVIAQVIRQGGAAVGKSPAMPPNPDLNDKPAVVAALVAQIRAMR